MRQPYTVSLLLASALVIKTAGHGSAADKDSSSQKSRPAAVRVTVDITEVPEVADWAKKARQLVEKWHPRIAHLLRGDGFTPPTDVKIVFKKDMEGVAYTSGKTIVIAAPWIKKHPEDFGMVVHELTHVIQNYRRGSRRAGWLVEGIADYIRFYHYEPKTKLHINRRRASYRDGYRTAAMFLAWIEKTQDKDIIRKLNTVLRKGKYKEELFKRYTSKTLDELWQAFIEA